MGDEIEDNEEVRFPSSYILINTNSSVTECPEDGSETSTPETAPGHTPVHTPMHTPMFSNVHTSTSSELDTFINSTTEDESLSTAVSNASSEPRNFRLLSDVYDKTEKIDIDEELLMLSTEEPSSFDQATKEKEWRNSMET